MSNSQAKDAVLGFLRSMNLTDSDGRPQVTPSLEQLSVAQASVGELSLSTDQIMSNLPRHKLTKSDFMNNEFKELKEKADHEASLPPEHIGLIDRGKLIRTLQATIKYSTGASSSLSVLFDRPQIYSAANMENLSPSTYAQY